MADKIMLEAIVFDMDGLLFDSERFVKRSWNMTGEELGIGPIGENIYHTLGMNLKSRLAYFHQVYGEDFPDEAFTEMTRVNFRKLADTEGIPLKAGAKELLEYAKSQGYKLAVATSSRREHSSAMMKEGGIYDYFDGFVFGDMVQNAKPAPEIYLSACEIIGAAPARSMALEDAPNGIRAAHAAGMYPVMIPDLVQPTEEIRALAYKVYDSLLDVLEVLKKRMEFSYCD